MRGGRAVGVVVVIVGLLGGGLVAAVAVERQPAARVEALGPAGLGGGALYDGPPANPAAEVTASAAEPPAATVSTPVPVTTTAVRRTTTSTATRPVTDPSPTSTLAAQPPSSAPATTVTTTPRVATWSATENGIVARMRMEPAAPAEGQPVSFSVEVSPVTGCCIGALSFGDETGSPLPLESRCAWAPGTVLKASATHTFAEAGVYEVVLSAATVPCSVPSPAGDGSLTVQGVPVGVMVKACVVVGRAGRSC